MNKKISNSIKSGIGSYILLILINYMVYLISGWTIMDEMIPGLKIYIFGKTKFTQYENCNFNFIHLIFLL